MRNDEKAGARIDDYELRSESGLVVREPGQRRGWLVVKYLLER